MTGDGSAGPGSSDGGTSGRDGLSVGQKASLGLGADIWHTAGVESAGIESIMLSGGPGGLRRQPEHDDHLGLPGEEQRVGFDLSARDLSFWSSAHRRRVVEPGQFSFDVGASSRDIRLSGAVSIDAPALRPELSRHSTLQEWLADPDQGPALRAAVGVDGQGRPGFWATTTCGSAHPGSERSLTPLLADEASSTGDTPFNARRPRTDAHAARPGPTDEHGGIFCRSFPCRMVPPMPDDPDETAQLLDEALQVEQQQERSEQQAEQARQGDVDTRLAEALTRGQATPDEPADP